jgi:hypothetical protein
MPTGPRSVKISPDERGGWSSERPRRPGEEERPPRKPDVSVRGRVLAPSDRLRYSPGSLVLIASADEAAAERFAARVLEEPSTLLAMSKIRSLLAGKVPDDQIDAKGGELRDAAAAKRIAAGQSVVLTARGLDAAERERIVHLAAAHRRPRHLILLEVPRDDVPEADHASLAALRTALDQGLLGEEGFMTSLRLGGAAIGELKRIVFAPPPADD